MPQETSSEEVTSAQETSAAEESTSTPDPETDGVVEAMAVSSAPVKTPVRKWKTPKGKKALSLTVCRNPDGTVFDLTAQAKQKLYGYDTVQGAAAGKGFGFFSLYNRKVTRAKIVKVRLKDMKVIKVSPALNICHANDFTYNNRKNILVVANSDPKAKRLTVIDVNTLKIKYHKTLKVTKSVSGMSKKQRKKFKGVGAIAYNEKHNCYICRMRKSNDLLFLDANLKPYKRVRQNKKVKGMLYQGMDSYKDCIMVVQSFKGRKKYNLITVYNMKGKYLARFKMARGMPALEMETVFHNGRQFYACFYSSYGAKADKEKLKIRRDNFVFRLNNL